LKFSARDNSLKLKEEKKRKTSTVQIGGIWKGVKIYRKDIKKVRKTLLQKIEEKW
jgi:hypothetical protein